MEPEELQARYSSSHNFLRLINRFLKPYWPWILLSTALTFLSTCASLPLPLIIKYLIDDVLVGKRLDKLGLVFVMILGVLVVSRAVSTVLQYVIAYLGQRVKFHIRHEFVIHLHRLSMSYYDRIQTGKLMSRIISDGYAIQEMIGSGMVNIFTDFFTLLVVLGILFQINWRLALITVIVLPCYAVSHEVFAEKMRRTGKQVRRKGDEIMGNLEECISGVRVVKSFVKERYEADQFKKKLGEHFDLNMQLNVLGTMWGAIAGFISGVGAALVLWYGGRLISQDQLTIGMLLAFLAYTGYVYGPIVNLIQVNATIQRVNAAIDRLFETLDTEPLIRDAPNAVILPTEGGRHVRFQDVSFAYSDQAPVLHHITLDVQPGMKVAIVGPSGSGKTTFVNLIPRLYEATSGVVSIDGVDVRKIALQSLRSRIGVVPQETMLFTGMIKDNIRYGRLDATDEEVVDAAKAANIHEFIVSLEHGYETLIGEKGIKLSGGQKQRIAIARALLTDPTILILDDCTSALDSKTEAKIQETLNELMRDRTSVIIAHRLSSVISCDWIYVLIDGRVAEQGMHADLVRQGGLYSRLYEQQFRAAGEEAVYEMQEEE
ncbi:MAG: ABC transporter ATP-binding protein [Candidatus Latescibacteria bacterium]|nr:ABC transporter ATP-binding protein [Candidatus Latescibacterota bacterium]